MNLSFRTSFSKFNDFISWNNRNPNRQIEANQRRSYLDNLREKVDGLWQYVHLSKPLSEAIHSKKNLQNETGQASHLKMKAALVIGALAIGTISSAYLNQRSEIDEGISPIDLNVPTNLPEVQALQSIRNGPEQNHFQREKTAEKLVSVNKEPNFRSSIQTENLLIPIGLLTFGTFSGLTALYYCNKSRKVSLEVHTIPSIATGRIKKLKKEKNAELKPKDDNSKSKEPKTVYDKLSRALESANKTELLSKSKLEEIRKKNQEEIKKDLEDINLSLAQPVSAEVFENWYKESCAKDEVSLLDKQIERLKKVQSKEPNLILKDHLSDELKICVATMKGDRETMEDRHIMRIVPLKVNGVLQQIAFCGVFDGHGGEACSEFLEANVEQLLKEDLPNILSISVEEKRDEALREYFKNFFVKINRKFQDQKVKPSFNKWEQNRSDIEWEAGSAAIISLIIGGKLWTVNAGDSRAIVSFSNEGKSKVVALSEDANPDSETFNKYIIKKGGGVIETSNRVGFPETSVGHLRRKGHKLAMARAVGYLEESPITARSKVTCCVLNKIPATNRFLIMACDGFWDAIGSAKASEELQKLRNKGYSCKKMASDLRNQAYAEGSTDNISVLVWDLSEIEKEDGLRKEELRNDLIAFSS